MKLGLAVFVAALLLASQILLPIVAEHGLRDELNDTGRVTSVQVSAFPALKLLGKKADSVRVRMRQASIGTGDLGDRLASTGRTRDLDLRIDTLSLGPLRVRGVTLRKHGDALTGSATLRASDFPTTLGLRPVSSADGALVLEADVGPVTARARLSADDGALVVAPDGLLGGLATLTLFKDRRVAVRSVGASGNANAFTINARGTVK